MARWRLTEKHYLNVPGTKWEFMSTDRNTGRPVKKVFTVPLYIDPEDKDSWNYRGEGMFEDGSVIVCHEGKGQPRDIVFIGDPTPGMLPLDDEAVAISAQFSWTPTQGLDEESQSNSHQQKLLLGLIDQMAELQTRATQAPSMPGMEQFMQVMTAMMQQNSQVLAALAGKVTLPVTSPIAIVEPGESEQVVDDEEPLPDADEPTEEEIAAAQQAYDAAQAAGSAKAEAKLAKASIRR